MLCYLLAHLLNEVPLIQDGDKANKDSYDNRRMETFYDFSCRVYISIHWTILYAMFTCKFSIL